MFLLTLLQFLPFTQEELLDAISRFMPSVINSYLEKFIEELYTTSSTVLPITIIITLWTASRGVLTIYRGLNTIYGIDETRNYILLRLRCMLYTLVFCVMLIMLLGLYVFGNLIKTKLTEVFPMLMQNRYALLFISFRTAIGTFILMIIFLVMYNYMPNRRSKIFTQLPGAVISSVGWVGFSYLYSIYIDNMGSIKTSYGSLTAAVLCILWLYFCMMIFFYGAEVNSVINSPENLAVIKRFFKKGRDNDPKIPQNTLPKVSCTDIPDTAEASVTADAPN